MSCIQVYSAVFETYAGPVSPLHDHILPSHVSPRCRTPLNHAVQRLAAYGIRSLLSSHRQENLTLDALASATGSCVLVAL